MGSLPSYSLYWRVDGPQSWSGWFELHKNFLLLWGIVSHFLGCSTHCLVSVLTALSWLSTNACITLWSSCHIYHKSSCMVVLPNLAQQYMNLENWTDHYITTADSKTLFSPLAVSSSFSSVIVAVLLLGSCGMITLMGMPFFVLFHPLLHCVAILNDPHLHQTVTSSHMLGSLSRWVQSVTGKSPVTSHSYWFFPHTPTHLSLSTVVGSIVWPEFASTSCVNI